MLAVGDVDALRAEQANEHVVDQGGGLQRVMADVRAQLLRGDAAQVGIDQRQQRRQGVAVAFAPTLDQLGDFA